MRRSWVWPACLLLLTATLVACGSPADEQRDDDMITSPGPPEGYVPGQPPTRITIVPDDYHVPYAGTAEDGRRFFLSQELFGLSAEKSPTAYVGLFLWNADGTFDELRVDPVDRPEDLPPGQAGPAGADDLVEERLAELGDYELEAIVVEPFTRKVDGVTFGWKIVTYGGETTVNIEPGDFIAYYEPWDGLEYDT